MFIVASLQYRGVFHQQATENGGMFGAITVNLLKNLPPPKHCPKRNLETLTTVPKKRSDLPLLLRSLRHYFTFWYPGYQLRENE